MSVRVLISAVSLGGLFVFAAGASPVFAAAEQWKELSTGVDKSFSALSCPEPRTCYVAAGLYGGGGTGAVVKTEDGGATFVSLSLPSSNPLHAISCPSADVCFAAGDFGTVLKTSDGGKNWTEFSVGSRSNPPHLTGVHALSDARVLVVGKDGFALRTADGGVSWASASLRTFSDLSDIYFADASVGFVLGLDGALSKTTDGGLTWTPLAALSGGGGFLRLRGAGEKLLIAAGDTLQKSVDGGKSWIALRTNPSAPEGTHRSIAVVDEKTSYSLVGADTIFLTRDGGNTWEAEASFGAAFLRDLVCPQADYCFVIGGNGRAFRLGTPPLPPPPPPPPPPLVPEPAVSALSGVGAASTTVFTPAAGASSVGESASEQKAEVTSPASAPLPVVESSASVLGAARSLATTLTRTLKTGSRGEDVSWLQELLAGIGGVYPEGEVTGYFGPATAKAVGRFQEKYNIAQPKEAGYGQAGPKTRAKLMEVFQNKSEAGSVSPAAKASKSTPAVLTRTLKKGSRGDDVARLQEMLTARKEFYPEGEVTGYFGPATAKAVGKFQETYGIAQPEEAGYGQAGPKTRAKLQELLQ